MTSTIRLGEAMCQCAACGRHFTTTNHFDKHRSWGPKIARYDKPKCLDPADIGLHQRANGAWGGAPMTDEQKAARGWAS